MKTQITKTEGINLQHNLGGLKVKTQVAAGPQLQHNLGGLKVKAQVAAGPTLQHNLGGLKVKALQPNDSYGNHAKKMLFGILAVMALLGAILSSAPASAASEATFVVNTTKTVGFDGVCNATECALAEAINAANANPGNDKIRFNIPANTDPGCVPATSVCTIALQSALPELTDAVTLDGYTQPGASPNTLAVGSNAALKIELKGSDTNFSGFVVNGGNTLIKGFSFSDFSIAVFLRSDNNRVRGNFFGMNAHGSATESNVHAIWIFAPDSNSLITGNQIGGSQPADRNVLNASEELFEEIEIGNTVRTKVQGNYFGTDKTGLRSNAKWAGMQVGSSRELLIGGLGAGEGNVFANSLNYALNIYSGSQSSQVIGNLIGVGADAKTPLGNNYGIYIGGSSGKVKIKNIKILLNVIANNTKDGVVVAPVTNAGSQVTLYPINVSISRNSIYNNGALGIDLLPGNVTANDPQDVDEGPNRLQNFPVLTKVQPSAADTTITGKLNSTPNKSFRIEFFTNSSCDASGFGEGKKYLGVTTVTTNGAGKASFTFMTTKILLAGTQVTATATDADAQGKELNTSEFSKCKAAS